MLQYSVYVKHANQYGGFVHPYINMLVVVGQSKRIHLAYNADTHDFKPTKDYGRLMAIDGGNEMLECARKVANDIIQTMEATK